MKYKSIEDYPVYNGTDLGATYSTFETKFRLWSPAADEVIVRIYEHGNGGEPLLEKNMEPDVDGTWIYTLSGEWKNKYYTYQVKIDKVWKNEVTDIYARSVGVNGKRGMIVDLKETNPENWENEKRPVLKSFNDIIIYELHLRDISVHLNSGIKNKGKFLSLTEKGTFSPHGEKTGLDHIIDLGVTHVHILPAFDFHSIDETKLNENKYNWGYDPENYNVPEGSYSTNPNDGRVRIKEFKQMVKSLHDNNIRVIMDVVYNHTALTETSNFEQLVPGYYYRKTADGKFSNASGCGNETASERPMMRKFIVESVRYWASEYHIDGFRFDLMGIHDIKTMNTIRQEVDKIDSTIFMYGEGWTAGDSPLPVQTRAIKANTKNMNRIAVFSDEFRDGIKGHWSNVQEKGFVSGKKGTEESVKFGIVGAIKHHGVVYDSVNYSKEPFANQPYQSILYVTCHDNNCLYDKLKHACPNEPEWEILKMQKLANAIVLTSQGVPFIFSGEEVVRTKQGVENSYNSPDSINWIDWSRKAKYKDVYVYYKSLISLRKNHPAFRMNSTGLINQHLQFFTFKTPLIIGYQINNHANGDKWKNILLFFNGNSEIQNIDLPDGEWIVVATGNEIDELGIKKGILSKPQSKKTIIEGRSMMILVDKESIK